MRRLAFPRRCRKKKVGGWYVVSHPKLYYALVLRSSLSERGGTQKSNQHLPISVNVVRPCCLWSERAEVSTGILEIANPYDEQYAKMKGW